MLRRNRLFAVARRLRKSNARTTLELVIGERLEALRKSEGDPKAKPTGEATITTFEFFKHHPELLDLDLARVINLEFLIKDWYRRQRALRKRRDELALPPPENRTERLAAKRWSKKHAFSASAERSKSSAEASSRLRRKAPNRSQPST